MASHFVYGSDVGTPLELVFEVWPFRYKKVNYTSTRPNINIIRKLYITLYKYSEPKDYGNRGKGWFSEF